MKRNFYAVLFFYLLWVQSLCLAGVSFKTFCSQVLTEVNTVLDEGNRSQFATITSQNNQVIVETPVGRYVFEADPHSEPLKGLPSVSKDSSGKFHVHIAFNPNHSDVEKFIQNQVRAAFIADPYLHPHVIPTVTKIQLAKMLSYPQKKAVEELLKLEKSQDKREGRWVGLVMPTGLGKTTTSAHFIKQIAHHNKGEPGWKKTPKVLFVVENSLILDGAESAYQKELGLNKIARLYGGENKLPPDTEMIFITRSGYFNKMDDIHKFISKDADQPWVIVLDEAHHLGTKKGQFEKILDDLQDKHLDHRHVVLTLSATLWHEDKDLIQKYLKGNVYGVFLNDKEQMNLRDGNDLIHITKEQLFRGMEQGYLAPLAGLHIVSEIKGISPSLLLSEFRQDVAENIAKQIKDRRLPSTSDRGAVFVSDTTQANKYAKNLSTLLGVEVRAFHGKLTDTERQDTFNWIKDEGKYSDPKEKNKHKYIVVVDLLNEGTDIPKLNLVVTAKTYSHEAAGFRSLIQNLGRGTRAGKESIRLIDYSGFSRVLAEGLERISVRKDKVEGNNGGGGGGRKTLDLTIDGKPIFIQEFLQLDFLQKSFEDRYPHFSADIFMHETGGAFMKLEEVSKTLGVNAFVEKFGLKQGLIKLAEKLKKDEHKTQLLDWLNDDKRGWIAQDGQTAKKGTKLAQQRAYEGIYKIAEALNKQNSKAPIDLNKIHEAKEFETLLETLLGQSLPKTPDTFMHERDGAFTKLEEASKMLGAISFATNFGLKQTLIQLANKLKDDEHKTQLLDWLNDDKVRGWTTKDGQSAKKGTKVSQQRAYEGIYKIAEAFNKQHPKSPVDFDKIHEAKEFERLLETLVGKSLPKASDIFMDKTNGAFKKLEDISKQLEVSNFGKKFGLKQTLIQLANKLKDDEHKTTLLGWMDDGKRGWIEIDGVNAKRGAKLSQQRAYEGIYKIAEAFNKQHPQTQVDLDKIHEAKEFEKLLKLLTQNKESK